MTVQNNKTNKKRKTKPNKGEYKVISIALVQPKNCITVWLDVWTITSLDWSYGIHMGKGP